MVMMTKIEDAGSITSTNPTQTLQEQPPPPPSVPVSPATSTGTKRKREAPKFYAVRVGKEPGVYYSWAECLEKVRGHPKAMFKSFTSLTDAENFVNDEGSNDGVTGKTSKWYGVRAGRKPGVYTSWQDVLEQITGWKAPKHKGFKTRAEAEQYVAEGQHSLAGASSDLPIGSIESAEPASKKSKSGKPKKSSGIKDEVSPPILQQGAYEPGEAPLPEDAEDNFDSAITLDHTTNGARYKTREERESFTYQVARPVDNAPIRIYTDGSSLANGRANAWGGVGVYFGSGDKRNISEPLQGNKQTNQRAELTAIVRALEVAPRDRKIVIVSDSKYAIDCVTDWFNNWQRNGWVNTAKKPVENKDLVQKIVEMLQDRSRLNKHRMDAAAIREEEKAAAAVAAEDKRARWDRGPGGVRFEWVKGHNKDEGNTAADYLAVAGARTAQELGEDVHWSDG